MAGKGSLPECDFWALRDWCSGLCDLSLIGDLDRFRFSGWGLHMGPAVLAESWSTAVLHDRTPGHVSRGNTDHFQISAYFRGGCHVEHRRGSATAEAGDIAIHDMTQPGRTRVVDAADGGSSHMVMMAVPRALLAPLLRHPDGAHSTIIRGGTGYGRLLIEQFRSLQHQAGHLSMAESEIAVRSMASLVAGAIGQTPGATEPPARLTRHTMSRAIKRHIADHLESSDLSAETLCHKFGLSRAALYRLFEPDGGLAHFVQQHRLHRAFAMLTSSAYRHWRIADIGDRCGYSSDATFIRAFRELFRTTPGEVRALAERGGWPVRRAGGVGPDYSWRSVMQWMEELAYGAGGPYDTQAAHRDLRPALRKPGIGPVRIGPGESSGQERVDAR